MANIDYQLIQKFIDNSSDGFVIIDGDNIIKYCNDQMCLMFGYEINELLNNSMTILIPSPHKELHSKYLREFRKASESLAYNHVNRKIEAIRKDKSRGIFDLTVFVVDNKYYGGIIRNLSQISEHEKRRIKELEGKNMFAANISHELRTPLNAIINNCNFLEDDIKTLEDVLEENTYEDIIDKIETVKYAGAHLLSQVNDILDYSKLSSNKTTLRKDSFSLRQCIESCRQLHSGIAREKQIEIITTIDNRLPDYYVGDEERLTQLLMNTVGNAIKFTDVGIVKIYVTSYSEDKILRNNTERATIPEKRLSDDSSSFEHNLNESSFSDNKLIREQILLFKISDSGIGIHKKDQDMIFEAFTQADNSNTRIYSGTGLGLAICRKVCTLMGGDIWLESSQIGKGSTFAFVVQLDLDESRADRLDDKNDIDLSILNGKKVLIVDDLPENLTQFTIWAAEWKMIPMQANSGKTAMVYLESGLDFDIALLDIRMPQIDGISLATYLRQMGAKFPIIALSSVGLSPNDLDKFHSVLQKPIRKDKLSKYIYRALLSSNICHTNTNENNASSNISISAKKKICKVSIKSSHIPILVAEDDRDNQKVIKRALEKYGYDNFTIVSNGQLVLDALAKKNYNIILMDIHMPVMDGLTTSNKIHEMYKNDPKNKPCIIALTAYAKYGEREFYVDDQHMDDFIPKPIDLEKFKKTMEKHSSKFKHS